MTESVEKLQDYSFKKRPRWRPEEVVDRENYKAEEEEFALLKGIYENVGERIYEARLWGFCPDWAFSLHEIQITFFAFRYFKAVTLSV
jgi:hypothetical protein